MMYVLKSAIAMLLFLLATTYSLFYAYSAWCWHTGRRTPIQRYLEAT